MPRPEPIRRPPPPRQTLLPSPYQTTRLSRPALIRGFYAGGAVPAWVATAEEVLRRHLVDHGDPAGDMPPARRLAPAEAGVAAFWEDLLAWREAAPGRRAGHRLLYEAVRRLAGREWFAESEGDALYVDKWAFDASHIQAGGR